MKFKIFALIAFLAVHAEAQDSRGGLFIEPSVTYEALETSTDYPAPFSDSSGRVDGVGLGARIGAHMNEAFFLGLDFRYASPQFKDSSVTYDEKSISTNWGPIVGIQMPVFGMRVWGSYVMGGELNPEDSNGTDFKFQEASGYRVGVGIKMLVVSFNLEYQEIRYGQMVNESSSLFAPGTNFDDVNFDSKGFVTSVSFPMSF